MDNEEEKISLIEMWDSIIESPDELYEENKEEIDQILEKHNTDDILLALLILSIKMDVLDEEEIKMVSNEEFINQMKSRKANNRVALTMALYNTTKFVETKQLKEVETSIIKKFQKGNLLNMTVGLEKDAKCPLIDKMGNVRDENGNIIPKSKLFEFAEKCYNIDDLLEYERNLISQDDEHEVFEKFSSDSLDLSGKHENEETIKLQSFSKNLKTLILTNNFFKKVDSSLFEDTIQELDLSKNPFKNVNLKDMKNLKVLKMNESSLTNILSEDLPESLEELHLNHSIFLMKLDVSNLVNLKKLHLSNCSALTSLTIPNTLENFEEIIANNNSFTKLNVYMGNSFKNLDLYTTTMIQTVSLEGNGNPSKVLLRDCEIFRMSNSTRESFNPDLVPENIENLQLVNLPNMRLGKNSLSKFAKLKIIFLFNCPMIDSLTSSMFHPDVMNRAEKLKVHSSNPNLQTKPTAKFNFVRPQTDLTKAKESPPKESPKKSGKKGKRK